MTKTVSNFFTFIASLVAMALVAGFYFFFLYPRPCDRPIPYSIGTLDTRFHISQEQLRTDIEKASALWESPIGKKLFVYDPKGELTVNLVYDNRQNVANQKKVLDQKIDSSNQTYSALKAQYQSLKASYDRDVTVYQSALEMFNSRSAAYTESVRSWNSKGGAPKAEYLALSNEKNTLMQMENDLEAKRLALNAQGEEVNTLIHEINALAGETNNAIQTYNNQTIVGKEFNEGVFERKDGQEKIDVYEFTDENELVRVLAHELGHALGLEHNSNPESIMYELNQSKNESLTPEDLSSLKTLCGIKN